MILPLLSITKMLPVMWSVFTVPMFIITIVWYFTWRLLRFKEERNASDVQTEFITKSGKLRQSWQKLVGPMSKHVIVNLVKWSSFLQISIHPHHDILLCILYSMETYILEKYFVKSIHYLVQQRRKTRNSVSLALTNKMFRETKSLIPSLVKELLEILSRIQGA